MFHWARPVLQGAVVCRKSIRAVLLTSSPGELIQGPGEERTQAVHIEHLSAMVHVLSFPLREHDWTVVRTSLCQIHPTPI